MRHDELEHHRVLLGVLVEVSGTQFLFHLCFFLPPPSGLTFWNYLEF